MQCKRRERCESTNLNMRGLACLGLLTARMAVPSVEMTEMSGCNAARQRNCILAFSRSLSRLDVEADTHARWLLL